MAKSSGIISFSGTLHGVNFYMRKGKPVARKAGGGFSGKAIKKSPKMVRVRENYTEFGNTSRIKKIFKNALFPFFGKQKDETLHGRMMQLFLKIKDCDITSERGKRQFGIGLTTLEGRQLLTAFDFTPHPLGILNTAYDAATFTYSLTDLGMETLSFKNAATHIELRIGVLVFDFEELKATLFTSAPLSIGKADPIQNYSLTPTEIPSGNGMRITVLSYRYVQELNGVIYPLKEVYGVKVLGIVNGEL